MQKRGQVSLEYLMLVAFVLIILLPAIVLGYDALAKNRDAIAVRQAEQAAASIVQEAEIVYYLGPPSKSTVRVNIPGQVFDAVVHDHEVVYRIRTQNGIDDVAIFSRVNLTGNVPETQGEHLLTVQATGTSVEIS